MPETQTKDFFISYTYTDKQWAEWIAQWLEQAGYHTIIQAWDFRPGSNFLAEMDEATRVAERTIAVLSPKYFESDYTFVEWAVAFRRDPKGKQKKLLPVRVHPCDVEGLLGPVVYIDLVGLEEEAAQQQLLEGIDRERAKPSFVPFPTPSPTTIHSQERTAFPGKLPTIWNVPYPRNPYFTGREEFLAQLAAALQVGQTTALSQPQAISGLGGIGKTQIAVEYVYRYHQDYEAVLWATAESRDALISSFAALAHLLNLPEQKEQDQMLIVYAVRQWLGTHEKWLLIFDNADELALLQDFIPPVVPGGHVLLTTRAQAMGRLAQPLEASSLSPELGALFLLRRARFIVPDAPLEKASPADVATAQELSIEMGGLPLALDQAGAYMEEVQCTLADYQQLYRTHRADLLKERGGLVLDHPKSVAKTLSLSFQRTEQASPASADLLRACAFLSPDAIPEEIITEGAAYLGPVLKAEASDPLAFNKAVRALLAYSLIRRDATAKLLSVHRLVQAVLKDSMDETTVRQWIERVVRAVHAVFPRADSPKWQQCTRYLPHANMCAALVTETDISNRVVGAESLFGGAGYYFADHARYAEAEAMYELALAIYLQSQPKDAKVHNVPYLTSLANVNEKQGKVAEAEELYAQGVEINEECFGRVHPQTAWSITTLALFYERQRAYAKAEEMYQAALRIRELTLAPNHPDIARSLGSLIQLYAKQDKVNELEPFYQRVLALCEQQKDAPSDELMRAMTTLAKFYSQYGKLVESEQLYQQAAALGKQLVAPESSADDTITNLNSLGIMYAEQGKYVEAEPFYQQALAISEKQFGVVHPHNVQLLSSLASCYTKQGKYAEAEALYLHALDIRKQLDYVHSSTTNILDALAWFYNEQKRFTEAERCWQKVLEIWEQLNPQDIAVVGPLVNLALLHRQQEKYNEAERFYLRALSVSEQPAGDPSRSAQILGNLAWLYEQQEKYNEAESYYQRAVHICEQSGANATRKVFLLSQLAHFYEVHEKYKEAETVYHHALDICEQRLGPKQDWTHVIRRDYALLLRKMGRETDADQLEDDLQSSS